jgi:putative ABC transport system permease protein
MAAGTVPVARRQLLAEPAKLGVSVIAVAAAIALVLLLAGLRRGMGEQVTLYLDHQAPVLVGQKGARNFLSQTSVLPEELVDEVRRVPGVAEAIPITQQYAMLRLHGGPVLTLLIGYDPAKPGGPWALASGRAPSAGGELVLDRLLASEHGLEIGSTLGYRGARLRIVGLSSGTSGFMTPLAFATRTTVNALSRQPSTANFVFVQPDSGVSPDVLAARIDRTVPGVSALTRREVAARDRRQFVDPFSGPLFAMVAISFSVAILVIGLAVYSSTAERSREYATLKALGLGRWSLFRLVGAQAAGLALAGMVLGILLALGAARGVSAFAPKYLIAISTGSVAAIAVSALAIALAASLVPARFVARLDPVSALRR